MQNELIICFSSNWDENKKTIKKSTNTAKSGKHNKRKT